MFGVDAARCLGSTPHKNMMQFGVHAGLISNFQVSDSESGLLGLEDSWGPHRGGSGGSEPERAATAVYPPR